MSIRFSRWLTGVLIVLAVIFVCGHSWAVFHALGPSQDEWKLKYNVKVSDAGGDKLNIAFTLADQGRLKPIHSITLIAFSKQTDSQGGRSYDVKVPIELKPTAEGKIQAEVQMRKEFADRAFFRILTLTVDGKRQTSGAAYYDIPIKKQMNLARGVQSPAATALTEPPSAPKASKK